MPLLKLLPRDGAASLPLGAIIAIVVVGTLFLAGAGALACAWIARCNRRKQRLHVAQQEEGLCQKEMMAVSMLRDANNIVPTLGANGQAAAASSPAAYSALSDCGSPTCCSLASSFDTDDHEGTGFTWWWRYRWQQMRRGSNTKQGHGSYGSGSGSGHNCPHGHDHLSHHRRRTGDRTGPRKLQRRRPETSIIASTNSLFFPAFDETSHNDVSNRSSTHLNAVHIPGSDSINHHNYKPPQRPPPPADQQRLLPTGQDGQNGQNGQSQNMRYLPQQPQQNQRPVSLQPTLPRPPQPALIVPHRPQSQAVQNMPVQLQQLTDQQRHMLMMQQQHLQQQMAYYRQQISLQQQEQQRRGHKTLPPNFATDSALSEILRSTEKRLKQLQAEPESGMDGDGNDSPAKRASLTSGSSDDEAVSPILDAVPTPLSSPSKSPRKLTGAGLGTHNGIAPAIALPPPVTSSANSSSPDTRSSVYSSSPASPASSRSSSLSTVYSADERDALAGVTDGPFASKGMTGLGITGANVPEDNDTEDKTSTLASRRSRRMSLSVNTNSIANNVHIPNPPPRSPKRSSHRAAIVSSSMVMMGGGVSIPHGIVAAGQNPNNTVSHGSPTKRHKANNANRDRPQLMTNSGIRSSFGPNRYIEAAGSASDDSDNLKEDDDLLPRHHSWDSQTSTASYKQSQAPQGPRAEPTGARRSRQGPSDALRAVEAEQALFQQSVRALPKPQPQPQPQPQNVPPLTVGNLAAGHRNTVMAIAADLRRMNSTAYSDASSCYSNATTATSVASGQPGPGSLAGPRTGSRHGGHGGHGRRSHHRRSSSSTGADAIVGVAMDAGPRTSIGSRQYMALGAKHMSMMAPEKENLGLALHQGPSQQRLSYDALTTLARAAAASNAPPVSSAPRRARSKQAMSMATVGTTLLRVDENPGSGASTPRNTPSKTPHATPTKANTGKPLTKSPSKGSFVGSVEPSVSSPLRKSRSLAPGSGPSTPSKSKRDSLGLYDQDGFLLSSPCRAKQQTQQK